METFYMVVFACFCMPVITLVWNQGIGNLVEDSPASKAFRNNYLLVYCLQMRKFGSNGTVVLSMTSGVDLAQPASDDVKLCLFILHCIAAGFIGAVGDWLQGPYVYALYEKYGYTPAQIGQLFIAGFGASLVVGTFIGALADRL